jgi:hypothetical protein
MWNFLDIHLHCLWNYYALSLWAQSSVKTVFIVLSEHTIESKKSWHFWKSSFVCRRCSCRHETELIQTFQKGTVIETLYDKGPELDAASEVRWFGVNVAVA